MARPGICWIPSAATVSSVREASRYQNSRAFIGGGPLSSARGASRYRTESDEPVEVPVRSTHRDGGLSRPPHDVAAQPRGQASRCIVDNGGGPTKTGSPLEGPQALTNVGTCDVLKKI